MTDLDSALLSLTENKNAKKKKEKKRRYEEVEEVPEELQNMSEFQREMMAAEEYEQRRDEQERKRILSKAKEQKDKASSISNRDVLRSSNRTSASSKKAEKADLLSELSKRRAKKAESSVESRMRTVEESDEEESDKDEESQDTSFPAPKFDNIEKKTTKAISPPLTTADLNSIRIKRDQLEKWVNEAFFEDLIKGYFVRVGVGMSHGKQVYRVAVIDDVKEDKNKKYKIGKAETNKVLVLKYASFSKTFRMEYVSNQDFTAPEVEKWVSVMKENEEPMPTVEQVRQKEKKMQEFLKGYRYTNDDVNKILEMKKKIKQLHRNLASERIALESQIQAMKDSGEADTEPEKFGELTNRLAEVEKELEERKAHMDNVATIATINKRNREVNEVEIKDNEKFIAAHARRKTKPTFMFGQKPKEEAPQETETQVEQAPPSSASMKMKDSFDDLNLRASMDRRNSYVLPDIDIDIDAIANAANTTRKPSYTAPLRPPEQTSVHPAKTISVNEYKRRRGLI